MSAAISKKTAHFDFIVIIPLPVMPIRQGADATHYMRHRRLERLFCARARAGKGGRRDARGEVRLLDYALRRTTAECDITGAELGIAAESRA